ncbi:MAG: hypothetical protein ACYTEE_10895 [Planctomycetota bacterium]|jgi:hypothetical protein
MKKLLIDEQVSDTPINEKWDHEAALKTALQEREALLKTKPQLKRFQDKIDERLSSVDDFQIRIQIIGTMIANNLEELHKQCNKLGAKCKAIDIDFNLPIIEIKMKSLRLHKFL